LLEREVSGEIKIQKEEIYSKGIGGDEEDGQGDNAPMEESEESEVDDEEIFKKKKKDKKKRKG
jgi:hypothetical protein